MGLSAIEKLIWSLENAVPEEKKLENTAVEKLKDPHWNPSFASSSRGTSGRTLSFAVSVFLFAKPRENNG